MRIAFCIAAGGVLHSIVVFAPWLATVGPRRVAEDPRSWVLLALVNLFYAAELSAMRHAAGRDLGSLSAMDRRLHRLSLASCIAVVLILWTAELEATVTVASLWALILGAAIASLGVMLRACAIVQLGRRFVSESTRPGGGVLTQDGVYAWVRHPSETGLVLIVAGLAILMESRAAALLCGVVFAPLVLARVRLEDRGLRDAFRAEFDRYRARVPALAPFPCGATLRLATSRHGVSRHS